MLATKDLNAEMAKIEKTIGEVADEFQKAQLKASVLQLKLLQNIRANLVAIMDKIGASKVSASAQTGRDMGRDDEKSE
jgi:hypothetical protein